MAPEVTSTEVVKREPAEIAVPAGPGLVQPIAELAAIRDMFLEYQKCVAALLTDDDYQQIGPKKFKKKSAWRKLGTAFGLSGERITAEDDYLPDGRIRRAKRTVRAIAPNGRSMDGEGVCDIYERCCEPGCTKRHEHCPSARSEHCVGWTHFSHAEHDIPTTAYTRALNRAVSDLIGAGEVSAEEIVGEGEDGVPHRRHNGNGNGEAAPAYDGKLITSQYDGKCVVCEGPIKKGDQVVYKKGKGAWHPTCDPRAGDGADVEPSKDLDEGAQNHAGGTSAAPAEKVETVGDQNAPMNQAQRDLHQRLALTIAKSAGQPKPTMEAGLRQIGGAIGLDNLTAWEYDTWTVAQADAAAKALTKELKDLQDAKKEAGS